MIPIVGFTCLWVLLSEEMNIQGRFQYAVLPLMLMSVPGVLASILEDFRLPPLRDWPFWRRAAGVSAAAVMCLAGLAYAHGNSRQPHWHDGRADAAAVLADYAAHGYTLATSEAGLLPLYSTWRTIDTWGLNDPWIAHHGAVTAAYLDRHRPEVIVFHAMRRLHPPPRHPSPWDKMTLTLDAYARNRGYVPAAAFGYRPEDTHYYYVRPDFPHSGQIVRRVRSLTYVWYENGAKCTNYAAGPSRPVP